MTLIRLALPWTPVLDRLANVKMHLTLGGWRIGRIELLAGHRLDLDHARYHRARQKAATTTRGRASVVVRTRPVDLERVDGRDVDHDPDHVLVPPHQAVDLHCQRILELAALVSGLARDGSMIDPVREETLVVPVDGLPVDPTHVLGAARPEESDVRLVLLVEGDAVPAALLGGAFASVTSVVRIPRLTERRDDLPLLIAMRQREVGAMIAAPEIMLDREMPALLAHDWPGNLDELDQVVLFALAVRKHGSLRAAAEAIPLCLLRGAPRRPC